MTKMELILADLYSLQSALKTFGYAMEFMEYMSGEKDLIEISGNVAGGMECLLRFHNKITDDMEELVKLEYIKARETNQNPEDDTAQEENSQSSVVKGQGEAETP